MLFIMYSKTKDLYEHLGETLTLEKMISYKLDINEISNECKKHNMFIDSKDKYDAFILNLEKTVKDVNKKLITAWNHMDDRLSQSPTDLHFKGSIILTMPVIDYILQKYF
jgi:flagellar biosynthesis chaperone FliJ